jgi:site-specific recombinase XerD
MSDSMPVFVEEYLDSLHEKGRKPTTIKRYRYDLLDFLHWYEQNGSTLTYQRWASLTDLDITDFFDELIQQRSYKIRTTRRIYSVLQQLARFYIKKGQLQTHAILHYSQPELILTPLKRSEWLSEKEADRLLSIVRSYEGLTDNQMKGRPMLIDRNEFMVHLFLHYGCSLHEVASLTTSDVRFERNELRIRSEKGVSRIVRLSPEHKQLAYTYFKQIPEPVRPRLFSTDFFFVAFDFQRGTYRWSYEEDQPKRLTEIAIQKMIRTEVERAGLRKGHSAQQLRHTFILRMLMKGFDPFTLQQQLGLKSALSFNRYLLTIELMTSEEKEELLSKKALDI